MTSDRLRLGYRSGLHYAVLDQAPNCWSEFLLQRGYYFGGGVMANPSVEGVKGEGGTYTFVFISEKGVERGGATGRDTLTHSVPLSPMGSSAFVSEKGGERGG